MEDENTEVDLSLLYFSVQLKRLLAKGKELSVNVMAFHFPAVAKASTAIKATSSHQGQIVDQDRKVIPVILELDNL